MIHSAIGQYVSAYVSSLSSVNIIECLGHWYLADNLVTLKIHEKPTIVSD